MAYFSAQATLTSASLGHLPANYYPKVALEELFKKFMFQDGCMPDRIPQRSGYSIQWFRYGVLAANTTARTTAGGPGVATEGQIGSGSTLTSTVITATVSQYTDYIAISDFAQTVHIDDVQAHAATSLGYRAGLSVDTVTRTEFDAGSGTAVLTVLNGSTFTAKDASQAALNLQAQDVSPMDKGKAAGFMYGIMHPYVIYDFLNDPQVNGYADLMKFQKGDTAFTKYEDRNYVATIHNVKFYASNNVKITAGSPNTYRVYIIGKDAVGSVDLAGNGPSKTNDVKVKPFNVRSVACDIGVSNPEGVIGGLVSYNFSFAVKTLQTSPYRFRYFDPASTIG